MSVLVTPTNSSGAPTTNPDTGGNGVTPALPEEYRAALDGAIKEVYSTNQKALEQVDAAITTLAENQRNLSQNSGYFAPVISEAPESKPNYFVIGLFAFGIFYFLKGRK